MKYSAAILSRQCLQTTIYKFSTSCLLYNIDIAVLISSPAIYIKLYLIVKIVFPIKTYKKSDSRVCIKVCWCVLSFFRSHLPTFAPTTAAMEGLNRNRVSGPGWGSHFKQSFQTEKGRSNYRILTVVREAAPGAPESADAPSEAKKFW